MIATATLELVDGTKIVVPDSLDLITPYVVREQQDWFEDEIKFLRRVLRPGQRVIDIGANYGVYTLSVARTVGAQGKVWAFEPASTTAELLAQSIVANGFDNVVLDRRALSSSKGTALLSLSQHSELNALIRGSAPSEASEASESVAVTTLDDSLERYGWQDVDFLKIDAEGEENNILQGGRKFFAALSPLVQYEVKVGAEVKLQLVQAFKSLGYDSYRLVPGLDLLIPFRVDVHPDSYLLNLFCCKFDRAAQLSEMGFLLDSGAVVTPDEKAQSRVDYQWRQMLRKFPYGNQLADTWEKAADMTPHHVVDDGLALYMRSRDSALSASDRFRALDASFTELSGLCERDPSHLRLASLARVARDYGARAVAVKSLALLLDMIVQHKQFDVREPFLAPTPRFDSIDPNGALGNWILSSVLEGLESLSAFSSFYTGMAAKQRLEMIRDLGFASTEMQRRLNLVCQRSSG